MNKKLSDLQKIIEDKGLFEYRIEKVEPSGTVTIIGGGYNFPYCHDIEIIIKEMTYISCPMSFDNAVFRLATEAEKQSIKPNLRSEWNNLIICIELDDIDRTIKHYIFAEEIDYKVGIVYHYKKDDLKEGERIADWIV